MALTGRDVVRFFDEFAATIEGRQAELNKLDAVAGDGDHGATMVIALRAVCAGLQGQDTAPGETLRVAADRFARVGGSTGPLWGTAFLRAARSVDGHAVVGVDEVAAAAQAAAEGVAERGRCSEGEKTLLDVLGPIARSLADSAGRREGGAEALDAVVQAAREGCERTREMPATRGRARRAGDASRGHPDPGAQSVLLAARAARAVYDP
jgi:dihydroxyacetone kinase-like protein